MVWLARDAVDGQMVALKLMHPHLLADGSAVARLRREMHAARRVGHPAILAAKELVEVDGRVGLVMPYFEGQPIADHVEQHGPWTAEALMALARRVAEALGAAHRAGVVHRDVSPNNVLVDGSGVAALSDFGLARVDGRHTASATGMIGTFGFAAPEVVQGQVAGPRSDLYGLGAVLYQAATGTAPFAAPTPVATLTRQVEGTWTPLTQLRPDLPVALTALVDALLHPDPSARPGSAREVLDVLQGELPPPLSVPVGMQPELPAGRFRVVVHERASDAGRRKRLRSLRRDGSVGAWVGSMVSGVYESLRKGVFGKEGRPDDPEASLRRAVADAVGLPGDAIEASPGLLEPHFRLVEGVSGALAERLAHEARVAGFDAVTKEERPRPFWRHPLLLISAIALASAGLFSFQDEGSAFILAGVVVVAVLIAASGDVSDKRLPLAYGADLRVHLTPEWRERVGRRRQRRTGPDEREDEPDSERVDPLLERTRRRLKDLDAALDGAGLAPLAVSELRRTLRTLAEEAGRLGETRESLRRALELLSPEEEAAIQRARQRLVRLQTRQAAGLDVDDALMARLTHQVGGFERAQARNDELDARIVALDARMVEIGDAAAEVRAKLAVAVTDTTSDAMIEALKVEADRARRAQREVAALR